jgi:UDP-2-acetamido-3-amino-2,3-dideoxy-glucuronate N-acetyltransferase
MEHCCFTELRYIHPDAVVGHNTGIGLGTVVEAGAFIGDDCVIGHHVVIHGLARIGNGVRIDDHAVIGKLPLSAARSKTTTAGRELPPAAIGEGALIGTAAIVYAGAVIGAGVLVADTASVREDSAIGDFTIIGRNAIIENRVTIGTRCKIQADVYICAYSRIGDDCFIAPCVTTSNDNYAGRWKERTKHYKGVTVENGGRIAVNATILPGRVIGPDGMAAAGAVVTKDIPSGTVAAGNPARKLRDVPPNQLLENQED